MPFHTDLDQIKEIIYRATEVLCKYLDPSHILMKLKSSLILTDDDVYVIKSHPSMEEKVDELLSILKRKSEEAYFCLMEALRNLRPDLFKEIVDIERACITGNIHFTSFKKYFLYLSIQFSIQFNSFVFISHLIQKSNLQ